MLVSTLMRLETIGVHAALGAVASFGLVAFVSSSALADEPPSWAAQPSPAAQPPAPASASSVAPAQGNPDAPPASQGFQLQIRTGVMIPGGNLSTAGNGTKMSDVFGPQVPIHFVIGGKLSPNVFLGGVVGLGFGGAGGKFSDQCNAGNLSCTAATFRIGAEVQYHFSPDRTLNPWLGYGLSINSVGISGTNGNGKTSIAVAGFNFADITGGFDYRASKSFGIGPYLGFSVGKYLSGTTSTTINGIGSSSSSGDIQEPGVSFWGTIGVRAVIFP